MKKILLLMCAAGLIAGAAQAQDKRPGTPPAKQGEPGGKSKTKAAEREFSIIVFEQHPDSARSFNHEIAKSRSTERNVLTNIFDSYRNTFATKGTGLVTGVIETGVNALVGLFTKNRDNKATWQTNTQREMTYTKSLPMQTEIADFYKFPSEIGAMDPNNMIFRGFGCRQYLNYEGEDGKQKSILVLEIACSMDESTTAKQRIVNHSKFEIKVDSIKFNPYLCDLPNDTLTADEVNAALRIPFDFKRRKDLTVRLTANMYSSWMNEAIEVFKDQLMGQFKVEFTIPDSTALDPDGPWKGYFTYYATSVDDRAKPKKNVTVSGESFIVPRSFVGNYKADDTGYSAGETPLWGTGQYRIDMTLAETCQMNQAYYTNNELWKEEWKLMKKRKKQQQPTFWSNVKEQAIKQFDLKDRKWIVTLIDPAKQAIVVDEEKWLGHIITGKDAAQSMSQQTMGMSQQGGTQIQGGGQQGGAQSQQGGAQGQQGGGQGGGMPQGGGQPGGPGK